MNAIAIGLPTSGPSVADDLLDLIERGLTSLATALTNVGVAVFVNRALQAGTAPNLLGWGTGSTAAALTDTDLVTEASETLSGGRVSSTQTRVTTTVTNDTWQFAGTIIAAGAKTIAEVGNFDAQSVGNTVPNAHGNLLLRGVFTGIGMNTSDSITFTNTIKVVPNLV